MMTPTEIEADDPEQRAIGETAVLEVSSMLTGGSCAKQEDVVSNYSTSVEGSVVRT